MAKKLFESSRPAPLKRANSEDIASRHWTEKERQALRLISARQKAPRTSGDAPQLTDEQLARMVRLRDPRKPKVAVSVRLDPPVLDWLRSKGEGHLTRINDILTRLLEAERGQKP